jgi:hypothetical protein
MNQIGTFVDWLFGTTQGVVCLVLGGILLFLIIAFVLERKTRRIYRNHEKGPDDWDLFDDDSESGWSDFEGDNE